MYSRVFPPTSMLARPLVSPAGLPQPALGATPVVPLPAVPPVPAAPVGPAGGATASRRAAARSRGAACRAAGSRRLSARGAASETERAAPGPRGQSLPIPRVDAGAAWGLPSTSGLSRDSCPPCPRRRVRDHARAGAKAPGPRSRGRCWRRMGAPFNERTIPRHRRGQPCGPAAPRNEAQATATVRERGAFLGRRETLLDLREGLRGLVHDALGDQRPVAGVAEGADRAVGRVRAARDREVELRRVASRDGQRVDPRLAAYPRVRNVET